jgi:hypothetical protein
LTIVSALATFNIHKSKDDTGSDEEVEAAYSDGAIRYLLTLTLPDNAHLHQTATLTSNALSVHDLTRPSGSFKRAINRSAILAIGCNDFIDVSNICTNYNEDTCQFRRIGDMSPKQTAI